MMNFSDEYHARAVTDPPKLNIGKASIIFEHITRAPTSIEIRLLHTMITFQIAETSIVCCRVRYADVVGNILITD